MSRFGRDEAGGVYEFSGGFPDGLVEIDGSEFDAIVSVAAERLAVKWRGVEAEAVRSDGERFGVVAEKFGDEMAAALLGFSKPKKPQEEKKS